MGKAARSLIIAPTKVTLQSSVTEMEFADLELLITV